MGKTHIYISTEGYSVEEVKKFLVEVTGPTGLSWIDSSLMGMFLEVEDNTEAVKYADNFLGSSDLTTDATFVDIVITIGTYMENNEMTREISRHIARHLSSKVECKVTVSCSQTNFYNCTYLKGLEIDFDGEPI